MNRDIPEPVRRLAEDSNSYVPLGPSEERLVDPRFIVYFTEGSHPMSTVVQRLRLEAGSVETDVAEVRALLDVRGRATSSWEVGTSATPANLPERLEALGMVPDRDPLAVGMVLVEPPPPGPPEIEVRRVETLDEYRAVMRIQHEAFEVEPAMAAERLSRAEERYREERVARHRAMFLAWLDGEPVASGVATFTQWGAVLNAGSTLLRARGRGAYRALVAARWEEAVRRGTPALIAQAGQMSLPILERLGFRAIAEIQILVDDRREAVTT